MTKGRASRFLDLSGWSLATKLSVSFCLVVLGLMSGVAIYSLKSAVEKQEQEELETLQDLASATAGRLDQLIADSKQRVDVMSKDNELETLMRWPAKRRDDALAEAKVFNKSGVGPLSDDGRVGKSVIDAADDVYKSVHDDVRSFAPDLAKKMENESAHEFVFVSVTDSDGRPVHSTYVPPPDPKRPVLSLEERRKRPSFRGAIGSPDQSFFSSVTHGTSMSSSFISFSHAIAPTPGSVTGVVSFSLNEETIGALIQELGERSRNASDEASRFDRQVFLVDQFGAVLIPQPDPDRSWFLDEKGQDAAKLAYERTRERARLDKPYRKGDYEYPFQLNDKHEPDPNHVAAHKWPEAWSTLTAALQTEASKGLGALGDEAEGSTNIGVWTPKRESPFIGTFVREDTTRADGKRDKRLAGMHPVVAASDYGWHVLYTEDEGAFRKDAWTKHQEMLEKMVAALALASLLLIVLVRYVTRQTKELLAGTQALAAGSLDTRIRVLSGDELGQLAESFNAMTVKLQEAQRKIEGEKQRADAARDAAETALFEAQEARAAAEKSRATAEKANSAKGTFLANMSHELRTPLNAIIGYGEMLAEEAQEAERNEEVSDLQKIVGAGKHLLGLINDILDLEKVDAGKMVVHHENVPVNDIVRDVVATVRPLVEKNGNLLETTLEPGLGTIWADQTKLRQSLLNLLSNASKFTDKGAIKLDVKRAGEQIAFSVTDTGIGMTPEQLARLFQPFSQADDSTSRKYGGTGLGLALTRRFCELMGGSVDVRSEAGRGSTFTILLPVAPRPSEAAPASGTPATNAERSILVIDDDPAMQELMRRALSKGGFSILSALNGADGLRLARERSPIAITLDVLMPGMNGFQVLEVLRADPVTKAIPVIIISMTDERDRGFSFGAADFLNKPVNWEKLVGVLDRIGVVPSVHPILIVEDDAANRDLIRRMLEKAGWGVEEAENGQVALARIEARRPALVLLDLMMPNIDGFDLVVRLRERDDLRDIPVVVITAKDLTNEDRERMTENVRRILQKGKYSRDELLAYVHDLVAEQIRISPRPAPVERRTALES